MIYLEDNTAADEPESIDRVGNNDMIYNDRFRQSDYTRYCVLPLTSKPE